MSRSPSCCWYREAVWRTRGQREGLATSKTYKFFHSGPAEFCRETNSLYSSIFRKLGILFTNDQKPTYESHPSHAVSKAVLNNFRVSCYGIDVKFCNLILDWF